MTREEIESLIEREITRRKRLRDAAPDLFRELKKVRELVHKWVNDEGDWDNPGDYLQLASIDAAIAKAEGKE